MNESALDLEVCAPWLLRRGRRPGPVLRLDAAEGGGELMLRWSPPRGSRVEGYLIDRTRTGRDYERVTETEQTQVFLPRQPLHDGWFYRVRAWNARGEGGFKAVFFYLRRGWSPRTRRASMLQYVAVIPGLRVVVHDWLSE